MIGLNVAFGAARSVPPDFENYVVSLACQLVGQRHTLKIVVHLVLVLLNMMVVLKISMLVMPYLLLQMLDLAMLVV